MGADGYTLTNEHLRIDVDPEDGTFTITTTDGIVLPRCNRLVDGGDGGDTYNYSPPSEDEVVSQPEFARVDVLERGPVRASLLVTSLYQLAQHAVGDERLCTRRSDETARVEVLTTIELRAGERFVRVRVELDNTCRDHRLRAHFPLPAPVAGSAAECAFAVVSPRVDGRGWAQRGRPADVRVAPLRRLL